MVGFFITIATFPIKSSYQSQNLNVDACPGCPASYVVEVRSSNRGWPLPFVNTSEIISNGGVELDDYGNNYIYWGFFGNLLLYSSASMLLYLLVYRMRSNLRRPSRIRNKERT